MHARGQLDEAARCFDALLSLKPGHQAWYTRECCVYLWNNIRRTWREFSPDAELDPEFKVRRAGGERGGYLPFRHSAVRVSHSSQSSIRFGRVVVGQSVFCDESTMVVWLLVALVVIFTINKDSRPSFKKNMR